MTDVPVRPASTVVACADGPELRVAVLERRTGSAFVPGMTVFPGGGVDPGDRDPRWANVASGALGVDDDELAHEIAAVRETWEEIGLFLGRPVPPSIHRRAVAAGDRSFWQAVHDAGAILDLAELAPIARWVTPRRNVRRYDTRFFVVAVAEPSELEPDGIEAITASWETPDDLLADVAAGRRTVLPPTLCTLQTLATHTDAHSVVEAARGAPPLAVVDPIRVLPGEPIAFALPGDDAYDRGRDQRGWQSLPRGVRRRHR